uniref:Uncharacterized protein n=1 Tax=virus sp. ct8MV80 TaxID=2826793 RepID=A0A8S5R8K1_9VIRU|nr:MAG TPA: hypothetical protein [virus sp. ct8MV80]DAV73407.1 MAG TPA: hypothetical protein [Bacteriophage sp.]DAW91630.1 MAG TPA: hypothetical protein [Bacteriophage sp.]
MHLEISLLGIKHGLKKRLKKSVKSMYQLMTLM